MKILKSKNYDHGMFGGQILTVKTVATPNQIDSVELDEGTIIWSRLGPDEGTVELCLIHHNKDATNELLWRIRV